MFDPEKWQGFTVSDFVSIATGQKRFLNFSTALGVVAFIHSIWIENNDSADGDWDVQIEPPGGGNAGTIITAVIPTLSSGALIPVDSSAIKFPQSMNGLWVPSGGLVRVEMFTPIMGPNVAQRITIGWFQALFDGNTSKEAVTQGGAT